MSETQEEQEEQEENSGVPKEDGDMFRGLRVLALQSMTNLLKQANEFQQKINESKTKPKKDLYTKKFNKIKVKFQDEIARLAQIEHTMKINNIPFEVEDELEEQEGEED